MAPSPPTMWRSIRTFRLNEQAEREIDSYLEREGEVELLARLQELRKVDIFAGK